MARDGYEVTRGDPLASAHARISAMLDDIGDNKPPVLYSQHVDITKFTTGKSIKNAPAEVRAELAAAALLRYTARKRQYTSGTYSPSTYSVNDYETLCERLAALLLRSKLPFTEATLLHLVTEVADYAADNVRSYPIKGLLSQLEHFAKRQGELAHAFQAPLRVIRARVAADAARYQTSAPAILGQVVARADALLALVR
ncbi:MAG: hypothetical protein ABI867_36975 [Kofleriaceae bacterium]